MKTLKTIVVITVLLVSNYFLVQAEGENNTSGKGASEAKAMMTVIDGKVVDDVTGEGLAGVSVEINGEIVYTDFEGNFSLRSLKTDVYAVKATYISYKNTVLETGIDSNNLLKIKMKSL
ncbi:MAG: carboxypeptidase-like regulatory domain-containing protein [Bacteroidales bacterium]|jgi:predicted butyrate kinase (DUF1464 family)|nr:carboxypeptidase-like regulatory domain-containing protein [Bacteroidales bacterium]